ncbi:MAG TPA: hypothetical protein VD811_11385 [Desulfuromonadales bacterium]|nr:hypothetical protein [Desulfuromonadales bacterium]
MYRSLAMVLSVLLLAGCSSGFFKIPREEYRQTVRTLGVLPLLVDADSTITHPEREAVVDILRRTSAGREGKLSELLRENKTYFDVRPVAGDPRQLYAEVVKGSSLRGEGEGLYRHYDFAEASVAALAQRHVVDALLIVILNGVERQDKRWDRLHLNYLQSNFNDIVATAAVVLPSGEVIWEYPGTGADKFLALQYPDFDEAYYNSTDQVRVKYITAAGLERTLEEVERGVFGKGEFSRRYLRQFSLIAAELKPGLQNPFKAKEPVSPALNGK